MKPEDLSKAGNWNKHKGGLNFITTSPTYQIKLNDYKLEWPFIPNRHTNTQITPLINNEKHSRRDHAPNLHHPVAEKDSDAGGSYKQHRRRHSYDEWMWW